MIESLVQPASSFASDIDLVINIVGVMVAFWGGGTALMFFWLLWRYRAQEGVKALYVTGNEPELKRWINIPHYLIILCDLVIIAFAVKTWHMVKQDMPVADTQIRVFAQQWAWTFQHPGADGKLDTEDDVKSANMLHVEVGKTYQFTLASRDVLHSFSVPVFRLKQDVIPGREITGWFKPTVAGTFDIQCTEMCGIGHGIMGARIVVDTAEQHAAWLAGAH